MKANNIRKLFLDFFKSKEHKICSSASIIVKDDPTLMFTNAGMNQFKDIFLGNIEPKHLRVANSQKCLRVSGKHNDLEEVGHDTYHHTMFEMLGTWSFGDYFKINAINWAWEFLIDVCKLDKDRFYVTVFEGFKDDNLEKDTESYNIWTNHIAKERILDGNKKDNFWEMGDIGPCGPCSEIHYDNRPDSERDKINGADLVNQDHPQVIEIWNLVFMEYNRFTDGSLAPLPNKHVDTGMGFERLCMIMQNVNSNYDTDVFQPLISAISRRINVDYGFDIKKDIAMRVIADHIRAIACCISDGQLPSNVKAGYVVRRILRRAVRYGYTFLNLRVPFICELLDVLVDKLGGVYPELSSQKELTFNLIKEEEVMFLRTLDSGLKRINQIIKNTDYEVSGKDVFELYDTYGFPSDLTALILNEHKLFFNQDEFNSAMKKQRERSKKSSEIEQEDWNIVLDYEKVEFVGYQNLDVEVRIVRYRKIKIKKIQYYQFVFNRTPFYAEAGGQVGDSGFIINGKQKIQILDTKKENNLIIHLSKELPVDLKSVFIAQVDQERRKSISRNHTATHLLHQALRNILGDHVEQKGSLVTDNYLRFDFSHSEKISLVQIKDIENYVNYNILQNISLNEHKGLSLDEARDLGAIMLFGEKYDDTVRMIQFDQSKELCGGTHVSSTAEIGVFKINSEGSISSGIRRIEAITAFSAINYFNDKHDIVFELSNILKSNDVKKSVYNLIKEKKRLEKQIEIFNKERMKDIASTLLESVIQLKNLRLIRKEVQLDMPAMKDISFSLRKQSKLVLVLAAKKKEKAILSVMITDDLVSLGLNAIDIVLDISKCIDGSGGGQPFFATAGGSNPKGVQKALQRVDLLLK